MNNTEEFVLNSLTDYLNLFGDKDKNLCLEDYYEKNIESITSGIANGDIRKAGDVVNKDYNNISLIKFDNTSHDVNKALDDIKGYYTDSESIYAVDNVSTDDTLIYSLEMDIERDFNEKEFIRHDEEFEI